MVESLPKNDRSKSPGITHPQSDEAGVDCGKNDHSVGLDKARASSGRALDENDWHCLVAQRLCGKCRGGREVAAEAGGATRVTHPDGTGPSDQGTPTLFVNAGGGSMSPF